MEVGTSQGYSAIWMGLALKDTGGRLTTIEIETKRFDLAKKYINQAGLGHLTTLILGDAHQEIIRLVGPFDFVLLEADKEGLDSLIGNATMQDGFFLSYRLSQKS